MITTSLLPDGAGGELCGGQAVAADHLSCEVSVAGGPGRQADQRDGGGGVDENIDAAR
jgi:hypothetical protein